MSLLMLGILLLMLCYVLITLILAGFILDSPKTIFIIHPIILVLFWPIWAVLWLILTLVVSLIRVGKFTIKTIRDEFSS